MREKIILRVDTVQISNLKFQPQELKVHKSDIGAWINNELVSHLINEMQFVIAQIIA